MDGLLHAESAWHVGMLLLQEATYPTLFHVYYSLAPFSVSYSMWLGENKACYGNVPASSCHYVSDMKWNYF